MGLAPSNLNLHSVRTISDNIEAEVVSVSEDIDHMNNLVDGHSLDNDEELKSSDAEILPSDDDLSICS